MSGFTQFAPKENITVPAVEEQVYDKYWLTRLVISAPTPDTKAHARAQFVPARDILDKNDVVISKELKFNIQMGDIVTVEIKDLFAKAAVNDKIATAMEAVFQALYEEGVAQNIFS